MKAIVEILVATMFMVMLAACYYGTGAREKIYTPDEYLYSTKISSIMYSSDSAKIFSALRQALEDHIGFFYSEEYYKGTVLIIDTIVYSMKNDKLAVFVIAKNPTFRQLDRNLKHKWYYNATCYLGLRKSDKVQLAWIGPNIDNGNDQRTISLDIRDACFTKFASHDSMNGIYKYNMNDKRFWTSPIWEKYFK
jgi:hypothetical protein